MPLIPPIVTPIIQTSLLGSGVLGPSTPLLVAGFANGYSAYMQTGVIARTTDVGVLGIGTGLGTGLILSVPVIKKFMESTFSANGINGPSRSKIINAVSITISLTLATALITTVHAGVGVGTGKVSLKPNPALSVSLMVTNFLAAGLIGLASPKLATAIAQGLDKALATATGVVIIAGSVSLTSGTGTGIGKLV